MSNIYPQLDHLLDKLKYDLRDLIDSAVSDEREKIMDGIRDFVGGVGMDKLKVGGIVEKSDKLVGEDRSGPVQVRPIPPVKQKPDATPEELRYCINCRKKPIEKSVYKSDHFCSLVCSNRWGARQHGRRKRGLENELMTPVLEPLEDKFCLRCGEPVPDRARHAEYCSSFCKNRATAARSKANKRSPQLSDKPIEELSNRPLIEFVGKKKKTVELPEEVIHRSNKSYADHLREKGLTVRKAPTFTYADRHEKEPE
jgi:hypothetical protein